MIVDNYKHICVQIKKERLTTEDGERDVYGLVVSYRNGGGNVSAHVYDRLCCSRGRISKLAAMIERGDVSERHIDDIIEDFIVNTD